MKKPSILCVDDEVNVLEGLQDNLRKQYNVVTAESGAEGLALFQSKGPFPVVVSDMRMPEMNGAQFLTEVRNLYPETMRILLTGQSDIDSAISAVNDGQIFRFLTKPCPTDHLSSIIDLALEHHRLAGLEKDLLENTLQGSVEALVEVLQLTNPTAFSRTNRLRDYVNHMAKGMELTDRWQYEIAALLSQVGFVALPSETIKKLFADQPLNAEEIALVDEHPVVAYKLISKIPRLENVASMILKQRDGADASKRQTTNDQGSHGDTVADNMKSADSSNNTQLKIDSETVNTGAKMLQLASEYDTHIGRQLTHGKAITVMRESGNEESMPYIDCLAKFRSSTKNKAAVFKMANADDLRRGMVLEQDVTDINGLLLMTSGQLVTDTVIHRLSVFANRDSLNQPFRVRVAA